MTSRAKHKKVHSLVGSTDVGRIMPVVHNSSVSTRSSERRNSMPVVHTTGSFSNNSTRNRNFRLSSKATRLHGFSRTEKFPLRELVSRSSLKNDRSVSTSFRFFFLLFVWNLSFILFSIRYRVASSVGTTCRSAHRRKSGLLVGGRGLIFKLIHVVNGF